MKKGKADYSIPHPQTPSPLTERGLKSAVRWLTQPQLWEKLKPLAREMRHMSTPEEDLLWQRLRNRKVQGLKFRRQHTIDRFILDFYCSEASLAIEVEGAIHQYTQEQDAIRREYLESTGLKMLRFSNDEVDNNLDNVIDKIAIAAKACMVEKEKTD